MRVPRRVVFLLVLALVLASPAFGGGGGDIYRKKREIDEHLSELEGIDLEIERLRVEGLLEAAGLNLAVVDTDGRQDTR